MSGLESDTMDTLLAKLRSLIDETRTLMAAAVNANLTMLYWRIGKRIHEDVLREERAVYGEQLIVGLSQRLAAEYGRGFSTANLRRMIQFAIVFPDEQIVVSLIRQLSWTHFLALLPLEDPGIAAQRDPGAQTPRRYPKRPGSHGRTTVRRRHSMNTHPVVITMWLGKFMSN